MKRLIIKAHPAKESLTKQIANNVEKATLETWWEVKIIDLYDKDFSQDFLYFEDKKSMWKNEDEVKNKIQDMISWADEMIFVYPMWWFSEPAILKNFLDCNLTTWFAFKYVSWKMMPEPLLKGKDAKVYVTCDGPWFYYFLMWNPYKKIVAWSLKFCWVKTKTKLISSVHSKSKVPGKIESELEKIYKENLLK